MHLHWICYESQGCDSCLTECFDLLQCKTEQAKAKLSILRTSFDVKRALGKQDVSQISTKRKPNETCGQNSICHSKIEIYVVFLDPLVQCPTRPFPSLSEMERIMSRFVSASATTSALCLPLVAGYLRRVSVHGKKLHRGQED